MNVNNLTLVSQERERLREKVPDAIASIVDMAYNLFWSWHYDTREMFKYLDRPLWYETNHNVVKMLRLITDERLDLMAKDSQFLKLYNQALTTFTHEIDRANEELWFRQEFPEAKDKLIAYLSMEYGIHNSLPIYSGGLGILSGDHLKESSDLGIPLIAVGFLYQEGYFIQRIPESGWQEESYKEAVWEDLPLLEVMDPTDASKPLIVTIDFNDIPVYVKVWMLQVGRVNLFLLDSNIDANPPWDRDLTDRLYGGSKDLRLKQEMILGIGAVRLLDTLNIDINVWHLNEGHCGFSSVERIWKRVKAGESFDDALRAVRQQTVFTTHTPVPAGHDVFNFDLVHTFFEQIYIKDLGRENFFSLGSYSGEGFNNGFNMTVLGMRTAKLFNGVAKLHGEVSRSMFEPLWGELKEKYDDYNPLVHVTNGVHMPSFVSNLYQKMFRDADANWLESHDDGDYWTTGPIMKNVSNATIWQTHMQAKLRLVRLMRERARRNIMGGQWSAKKAMVSGALFDPDVLTIGFARRFATYKRATLFFYDFERVRKMLNDPYRPVQIVFAGKAHPADDAGKKLIQDVVHNASYEGLGHRIAFIENYELVSAKMMLQGVDIWLNTPLRPNEASGTSGMKAAANFVPNLSIKDGWWAEGYSAEPRNGWAINEDDTELDEPSAQDWHDVKTLYEVLENHIIPMYYKRNEEDRPEEFVEVMKNAMTSALPQFSARRMLKDYSNKLYTKLIE